MSTHLTYNQCLEKVGIQPTYLDPTTTYIVLDETGTSREFKNLENATRIHERTNNPIKKVSYTKQELEQNKINIHDYFSKVNDIWFKQLLEEFNQFDPELFFDIHDFLENQSIRYIEDVSPDDIYESLLELMPVLNQYGHHVIDTLSEHRKAFYFKTDKDNLVKL